jgi:hypothetical protein
MLVARHSLKTLAREAASLAIRTMFQSIAVSASSGDGRPNDGDHRGLCEGLHRLAELCGPGAGAVRIFREKESGALIARSTKRSKNSAIAI